MSSRREMLFSGLGAAALVSSSLVRTGAAQSATTPAKAATEAYVAGTAERRLDIVNLFDLEAEAEKLIPKGPFGYISGGSGDEWTLKENVRAFDDRRILPRYLAGVETPDTETVLLRSKVSIPIFVPPMAAHGLAHASAENGSAKGAADAGALFCAQTLANTPLEDIAKASSGPKWFQPYYTKDTGVNRELIQKAKAIGRTAMVFTVDLEWAGNREADKRNNFAFPATLPFPNIPNAPTGVSLAELFTIFKRDLTFGDLEFIAKESGCQWW
jgi:L-lactate oxidase